MQPEKILELFARACTRFDEACMSQPSSDLHRAGCIQYFEFTFDLAWKSIQSIAAYYGLEPVKSPRVAFKVAFAQAWLETQTPWLSMLESRNRMAHVYNSDEALEVYDRLHAYRQPFNDLLLALRQAHRDGGC